MTRPAEGELAIVLHTHMPYVEGFGTWPFGEEWLWEAMATCYLPLLEVLERHPGKLTLSCTPVLLDQLEAPGLAERFKRFIIDVRRATHLKDIAGLRASGAGNLALELERAAQDYERAIDLLERRGSLAASLARHADWTSSATHAVLPLCASGPGTRVQIESGIAAHRARVGGWEGGFWLPECAYAPWLDPLLARAGVRASCLDLTDHFGLGAPEHLRPLRSAHGSLLLPIDRQTIELVWSDGGYPAHGRYRDYHRHTIHHHRPWGNDGAPYDHAAARAQAAVDAGRFLQRVRERLAQGGLLVCALDTELLGHWWYEGIDWLAAVLEQAPAQGVRLARLDDALVRHEPADAGELPVSSWGTPRDLSTWDGPRVADLAFMLRDAELRTLHAAGSGLERDAVRELLALQSSDWAFMVSGDSAAAYPAERAAAHHRELMRRLSAIGSQPNDALRNIAPHAVLEPLLEP